MLEVLQFIFSSFWHWVGTFFLLAVVAEGIGGFIRITINRNKDK
jgi:D-alanyl-lipoteichoic acid acyltransferase DltB (MBOAT superfamily)